MRTQSNINFTSQKFFGIVRHVAGDGGRPTAVQFLYIYRMLSVNNLIKPPERTNVESKGPELLLTLQSLFGQKPVPTNHVRNPEITIYDSQLSYFKA